MSSVPLGLIMRVADLLGEPLAVVEAILDVHQAGEDDVRQAIRAVEGRLAAAINPPHVTQLRGQFEELLPSWEGEVRALRMRAKRCQRKERPIIIHVPESPEPKVGAIQL